MEALTVESKAPLVLALLVVVIPPPRPLLARQTPDGQVTSVRARLSAQASRLETMEVLVQILLLSLCKLPICRLREP